MRRPRREAWSFLWVLKCSVSSPIRVLRMAIWTSGEPVSLSALRLSAIKAAFFSRANTDSAALLLFLSYLVTPPRITCNGENGKRRTLDWFRRLCAAGQCCHDLGPGWAAATIADGSISRIKIIG